MCQHQSAVCGHCFIGYYEGEYRLGHETWCPSLQKNPPPEKRKRVEGPAGRSLLQYHDHVTND